MTNIQTLTLEIAVGQCIIPRLDVDAYASDEGYAAKARQWAEQGVIGGFCIFGGSPASVISTISELRDVARKAEKPELLFSADCEFGLPMRLKEGGTEFPDAMALAKADHHGDATPAFQAARAIGAEMRALGLDWNFAPVADINSNPANPIINTRSFGETAEIVSTNARAYARGLAASHVLSTAKHFPGHGDTSQDSHRELPYVMQSLEEFVERELRPFENLIGDGVDSIMTGHLAAPKLAEALGADRSALGLPATLSRTLTHVLLRERMGFAGVVVTDALEMGAITATYGPTTAATMAFDAGADVILLPIDVEQCHAALLAYANRGTAEQDRLSDAVQRIAALKARYRQTDGSLVSFECEVADSQKLSHTIARSAISVQGEWKDMVAQTLIILVDARPQSIQKANRFAELMRPRFGDTRVLSFAEASTLELNSSFVLTTFHRARGYIGGSDVVSDTHLALQSLDAKYGEFCRGVVMIGSPYIDLSFKRPVPHVLRTYSEAMSSVEAVSEILLAR